MRNHWTFEEIEYLKTHYHKMSCEDLSKKLNRSNSSIFQKAYKLGLKGRPNSSWNIGEIKILNEKQIEFLKQNYEEYGPKYCAKKLNRKVGSISKIALKLNLRTDKSKAIKNNKCLQKHLKEHAKKVFKKHVKNSTVNLDEKLIKQLYLKGYSCDQLAEKFNCSKTPILRVLKDVPKRKPTDYTSHKCHNQSEEKNPNWKGGYKSVYDRIRDLKSYWDWRNFIIKRDNGQCQVCGTKDNLEVHHKTTLKTLVTKYSKSNNKKVKDLTFEDLNDKFFYNRDNGITYCKKCHKDYHKKHGR